jgi:hypothetical protein
MAASPSGPDRWFNPAKATKLVESNVDLLGNCRRPSVPLLGGVFGGHSVAPAGPLKSGLPSGAERQQEKFTQARSPRFLLASRARAFRDQARVRRSGLARARVQDLLAMAIPSRVAGPQISGATDMEVPPSSRTGGMMSLHAAARAAAPGHLVLYRVGEF